MPDTVVQRTARAVGEEIFEWAKSSGALASEVARPMLDNASLSEAIPTLEPAETDRAEKVLSRLRVVATVADDEHSIVTVLVKNQISAAAAKLLPKSSGDVEIQYVGHAGLEPNPPALPQSTGTANAPRCFTHNNRLACGSSVIAAPLPGAGTFGALVRLADGTLCGLTNNHVTGGCNHTRVGMPILCPAPTDADPSLPAPLAIGVHHSFVPLQSGDPGQMRLQELDLAIFGIRLPDSVTSMQGAGAFDTPTATVSPVGTMRIKKVGRSTGLTTGKVLGPVLQPLAIPYVSPAFNSRIYFTNVYAVAGDGGEPFSSPGDSGSLVVSEDGNVGVGIVFAGTNGGGASFIIPLAPALAAIGATLVGGFNVN